MTTTIPVLGIDLASSCWQNNGSALLTFEHGGRFVAAATGVLAWPRSELTPEAMAEAIDRYALEHRVSGIALDGPAGWRDPAADPGRPGCGRLSEYESRAPGKTCEFGDARPATYLGWIRFCIDVFAHLLARGNARLFDGGPGGGATRLGSAGDDRYWIVEAFPTSTWRTAGLDPLPGKRRATPAIVTGHATTLVRAFGLPDGAITDDHDDLQGAVSALGAAALLGGPCDAVLRGLPPRVVPATNGTPSHRVEGFIVDAVPAANGR